MSCLFRIIMAATLAGAWQMFRWGNNESGWMVLGIGLGLYLILKFVVRTTHDYTYYSTPEEIQGQTKIDDL